MLKGLSLEIPQMNGLMFLPEQKAILLQIKASLQEHSGVVDHRMLDIDILCQPGRSLRPTQREGCSKRYKVSTSRCSRKSDGCIVPKKLSNSSGGKAVTQYQS